LGTGLFDNDSNVNYLRKDLSRAFDEVYNSTPGGVILENSDMNSDHKNMNVERIKKEMPDVKIESDSRGNS
jgi:hypothetical protein